MHQKPVPFNTIHSISNISSDSMKNILIVKNANLFDLLKTQNLSNFLKCRGYGLTHQFIECLIFKIEYKMFFFNFKYQKCKYDTTAVIYLCQSITNVLYKYGAKD